MKNLVNIQKDSKNLRLLYVEDDADTRNMTSMLLDMFFDNIILAVDGEDGLQKFKENSVDIIITDINMPNMDGLEMCKHIRDIDDDIPIIIISAHNEYTFFIDSIHLGITGYLLKPMDVEQLSNVLWRVVQKSKYLFEAKENLHFLEVYKKAANLGSIVTKTDTKGIITYANEAFCKISGYTKDELIGKNHNIVRHPDNPKSIFEDIWNTISKEKKVWKGIVRNMSKDSKSYYVDSIIMPIMDHHGEIKEYISLRHDITDIMNPQKQLKDAIKDFENPILIYMKLDRFEMIEEFYDSDTLDKIQEKAIQHLEKRFSEVYEFDTMYALDNGEYALLIDYDKYFKDEETFIKKIKELQECIKDDVISLENVDYDISIIISLVYKNDKILESAKLGLKELLKTKRDFIVANYFAQTAQKRVQKNMKTISMIKNALRDGNIISYFQPIVDNKTKEIVKYESLVRLIDEDREVISPFFFLDTAKKSNYYAQITDNVLKHSFSVLKIYGVSVSINLSALDIEQRTTRENILNLLEEHSQYASNIVFELLEDEGVKEFEVIKQFIADVKKYGVKIAIDDFGAGYSNYERLLDYQPDILKIDGCLIRNIQTSSYSLSVVKSIVTFAKEQGIQTIAEFIENEEIFNIVKELGVDFSQGYYFNKPEPITHYISSEV